MRIRLPAGSRTAQSRTPGSAAGGRRLQDDGRAGLTGGTDRDPPHPAVPDVAADLEAEGVTVEGQGGVRVVVGRKEAWMAMSMAVTLAAAASVTLLDS